MFNLYLIQVMGLIDPGLSEPYSIFTYRYFLTSWPHLCYLALEGGRCCGTVVAKLERHREALMRGYIAMLVVQEDKRGLGIGTWLCPLHRSAKAMMAGTRSLSNTAPTKNKAGSQLVLRVIKTLIEHGCEEVVLEAEVTNVGALRLYERLGFIRDKRLKRSVM